MYTYSHQYLPVLHLEIIIYPFHLFVNILPLFLPVTTFLKYNYYQMAGYYYPKQFKGLVLGIVCNLLSLEIFKHLISSVQIWLQLLRQNLSIWVQLLRHNLSYHVLACSISSWCPNTAVFSLFPYFILYTNLKTQQTICQNDSHLFINTPIVTILVQAVITSCLNSALSLAPHVSPPISPYHSLILPATAFMSLFINLRLFPFSFVNVQPRLLFLLQLFF